MSMSTDPPGAVPRWIQTLQPDPERGTRFYADLLGWSFDAPVTGGAERVARVAGAAVAGLAPQPAAGAAGLWSTWIEVPDVARTCAATEAHGGRRLLGDAEWAVIADPTGAAIGVAGRRVHPRARRRGRPGGWALSALHSPDPDRAAAFCAAVFGWDAQPLGTVTALLSAAAGEALPEPGVPADTVAVIAPPAGVGIPAHWSVNLRVDDADAVSRRCAELGGRVLVAPTDTPGLRSAALLDPQGAAFSVSSLLAR